MKTVQEKEEKTKLEALKQRFKTLTEALQRLEETQAQGIILEEE
jgi:hypothetical protein